MTIERMTRLCKVISHEFWYVRERNIRRSTLKTDRKKNRGYKKKRATKQRLPYSGKDLKRTANYIYEVNIQGPAQIFAMLKLPHCLKSLNQLFSGVYFLPGICFTFPIFFWQFDPLAFLVPGIVATLWIWPWGKIPGRPLSAQRDTCKDDVNLKARNFHFLSSSLGLKVEQSNALEFNLG